MATFPFLPKDKLPESPSAKINVTPQPRKITMDDIADQMAPMHPDKTRDEVREILRVINNKIIDILLTGRGISMPDGSIWSLDEDGRTIWIHMPEDALEQSF